MPYSVSFLQFYSITKSKPGKEKVGKLTIYYVASTLCFTKTPYNTHAFMFLYFYYTHAIMLYDYNVI